MKLNERYTDVVEKAVFALSILCGKTKNDNICRRIDYKQEINLHFPFVGICKHRKHTIRIVHTFYGTVYDIVTHTAAYLYV